MIGPEFYFSPMLLANYSLPNRECKKAAKSILRILSPYLGQLFELPCLGHNLLI